VRLQDDDYPYLPLPSLDGKRLYVSLWGRAAVAEPILGPLHVGVKHVERRL